MAAVRSPSSSELGAGLACRRATGPEQVAVHLAIREVVFVAEQGIFTGSDLDAHDADPLTQHVIGYVGDVPAGAVRLYPVPARRPGETLWKGDRLAVLAEYRRTGIGAPLVGYAVRAAAALGGTRMIAHVQLANVAFFQRLGWSCEGDPGDYVGVPHQLMSIPLS
jgi:putative N-acetyltransferase (TIGR04045 family)